MADLVRVYSREGNGFKLGKAEADVFLAANAGSYAEGDRSGETAARAFRRDRAAAEKAAEEAEAEEAAKSVSKGAKP